MDTRYFKQHFSDGLLILTKCKEKRIYDRDGSYTFTIVLGYDSNNVEQQALLDNEVTNPKVQ